MLQREESKNKRLSSYGSLAWLSQSPTARVEERAPICCDLHSLCYAELCWLLRWHQKGPLSVHGIAFPHGDKLPLIWECCFLLLRTGGRQSAERHPLQNIQFRFIRRPILIFPPEEFVL